MRESFIVSFFFVFFIGSSIPSSNHSYSLGSEVTEATFITWWSDTGLTNSKGYSEVMCAVAQYICKYSSHASCEYYSLTRRMGHSSGGRAPTFKGLDHPIYSAQRLHLQSVIFSIPTSGPQLVHQRLWCVFPVCGKAHIKDLFCLLERVAYAATVGFL